jgi:hypothetical protein
MEKPLLKLVGFKLAAAFDGYAGGRLLATWGPCGLTTVGLYESRGDLGAAEGCDSGLLVGVVTGSALGLVDGCRDGRMLGFMLG